MTKIIVVGGGASGLVAAISAKRSGAEVIVLERNDTLAKKILITGNGKCNYWNEDQNLNHYHSSSEELLKDIITLENQKKVLNFFDELGIIPKIKNGYYYPYSNQAVAIKAALINEIENLKIEVLNNMFVEKIEKENDKFLVFTKNKTFSSDSVIIATGSKAAPKTGSDGNGYLLAKKFGHKIVPILPSLTQIYGDSFYYKEWNGIRLEAKVSLYEDDKLIKEETGEIHLTDYGVSGICIFNLSGLAAKGLAKKRKEIVLINFVPDLCFNNCTDFVKWLDKRNRNLNNRTIAKLFDGFINYKLVYLFLKLVQINPNLLWQDISDEKKLLLADIIINHKLNVLKVNDFLKAQVCSGGVNLSEINPKTMESFKVKNLYFTGEILDVDGDCGGYNLSFAWISGILAGEDIGDNNA